ncbi:response regulator [Roseovarius sp. Pro17]|uniref:response regulator n=1 Tax=Roseovarius sp. Pro17 TaxID=3108175 RepID=UPI002D78E71C|nr:response regulator [Roseovarius sp. Pro17]
MKILAVDDDPIILELLTEIAGVVGFTNLTLCASAYEALDVVAEADIPFDCLLLDIQMPNMDGIQLTSIVRKMPQYATTPILMITAMSDRSYIDSAFSAGASDYITKPFEIDEVHARLRLIEELLKGRRQKEDRNPVEMAREASSVVTLADLDKRLALSDIDGCIEYLALENYLLQVSKISLLGMSAVGIVFPDVHRIFQSRSLYEYESAITDVAEAISDCLKPRGFFLSHAGGGHFACVLSEGEAFDAAVFEITVANKVREMDLHFCDGRPLIVIPVVGDACSLQFKSGRGVVIALTRALADAEAVSRAPSVRKVATSWQLKSLLGY